MTFLDLTSTAPNPVPPRTIVIGGRETLSRRCKTNKRGKTVERDMRTVTGVTIHQTAVVFAKPRRGSKYERAHDVPAHMLAFRDGTNVLAFPPSHYLYHGNAFNETDVGLEYEGHYSGCADDPATPRREDIATTWKGEEPTPLTEEIIESFREALRELVNTCRALGAPLTKIHAHRQSNGDKPSDPGDLIWTHVVLGFAVPVLGLVTEPALTLRDGLPIPLEWDPVNGVGPYRR